MHIHLKPKKVKEHATLKTMRHACAHKKLKFGKHIHLCVFAFFDSNWKHCHCAVIIHVSCCYQAMGTMNGQVPLQTAIEMLQRTESERFVDRSHPAGTFLYCSTPQCQCWVWTYRLSRVCQTCFGCGRAWQQSYLDNGYSWWI